MISQQFLAQLGVIQGVFLFISFLSMGWHNKGHIALSALALIISIRLIPAAFLSLPEFFLHTWYLSVFNALIFLFGPLLWIYVINLTGRRLSVKLYKHFIPFTLLILIGFVLRGRIQQVFFSILSSLIYPCIAAYQLGMLIELRRFNKKAKDFVSNPERVDLLWFRMLLIGSTVLLLGNYLTDFAFLVNLNPLWLNYLPFVISNLFLFEIAYLAIRHPEADPEINEASVQTMGDLRYRKNRLDESTELKILENITKYMASNESYRNEELRLSDLACSTGYAGNTISMVLNLHQHENFYHFVNRYRIEDVKKSLSDPERASESILSIAMDSGFRSKSTFNTVFREITGKTPSQYRSGK